MKWGNKPRLAECPFLYRKVALATVQGDLSEKEIQVNEVEKDPANSVEVNPLGCAGHSVPIEMVKKGFRWAYGRCHICQSITFGQEIS